MINHLQIQKALRLKIQSLSLLTTVGFTRSTTATYTDITGVVRTAAINVLRSAHYVNGVLQSPVYELAGTNLCLQSEALGTTWLAAQMTVATDAATAPDGNATADKLQEDNTSSTHHIQQTITCGQVAQTFSIWVKSAERTKCVVLMSDNTTGYASIGVDLTNGATFSSTLAAGTWTGVSSTVTPYGSGWYRVAITGTRVSGTQSLASVYTWTTAISYLGVTGSGVYAWGAQLELGSAATSYFPTTTLSGVRAADVDAMFSATANGYARQTGSFITDGFDTGMEVRPSGFVSNPVSTLLSVTALTLTVKDARSVEAAAVARNIAVGLPTDFAWENIKFSPTQGRPYVEEDYIPGPMSLDTLGANGNLTCEPMYHLNIYVPQNSGIEADGGYADAILTLFAPSTEMVLTNGDKLFVRADVAPYQGQRQQVSGNSVIPITIPLRLFTNNSI